MKIQQVQSKITDKNPILIGFDKYLQLNYSSETTRYSYYCIIKNFIGKVTAKTGKEPQELTQDMLDEYIIQLHKKSNPNASYRGAIKALRVAFDPDEKIFRLKIKIDRSRQRTEIETRTDYLPYETRTEIINKASPLISTLVRLYFDTSARKSELLNFNFEDEKNFDMDLNKKQMKSLGKGNKVYQRTYSEETAKAIYEWINNPLCLNKNKPFILYSNSGKPYKNQGKALWERLQKECKALNIKLPGGREIFVHSIRHGIGHYLGQEKEWKIQDIATKLGHSSTTHTMRYAAPTTEEIQKKEQAMWDEEKND